MPFSERTIITVPAGGNATVTNIHKRPIFLPDDEQVETGRPGGRCLTCNKPVECPICSEECLANWTLLVYGGEDFGDSPMFGDFTRRYTVNLSYKPKDQNMSGHQSLAGTARTAPITFPQNAAGFGPVTGRSNLNYFGYITLTVGDYRMISETRTAFNTFEYINRFDGYGIFCSIYRRWERGPACTTKPNDNVVGGPLIRWPYRYAWSYPCSPMVNYSQWLYEAYRWPKAAGSPVGCFFDRGPISGALTGLGWVCDEWGGQQWAVYGRPASMDFIDSLSEKFDCDSFAGIELPLIKTSKESWTGVPRYKGAVAPNGRWSRTPYPSDWEDWGGTPPKVVLYPSEKARFKNGTPLSSHVGFKAEGEKS